MTVKECDTEPIGLIVPVKVSVASTGLGVTAVAAWLQAVAVTADASTTMLNVLLVRDLTENPAVSGAGTPSGDASSRRSRPSVTRE